MRKVLLLAALLLLSATSFAQRSWFEAPRLFTDPNTRFPQVVSNGELAVAAYQRISDSGEGSGTIDVVMQTSSDGRSWTQPVTVARDIRYEGAAVPPIYSVAVNEANEILLATVDYERAGGGASIVRVLLASGDPSGFTPVHTVSGDISLVSPRVSAAARGGWFLTMERFDEPSNRIVYSHSGDGRSWSELLAIPADVLQTGTQSDVEHYVAGDRDVLLFVGENVVPPGVPPGEPEIPDVAQIYAIYTEDGGASWSATDPADGSSVPGLAGIPLDDDVDFVALAESGLVLPHTFMRTIDEPPPGSGALTYQELVMRRPSVAVGPQTRLLTFEVGLRLETDNVRQIAVTALDAAGNVDGEFEILTAASLRSGDARTLHNQPTPAVLNGSAYVIAYQDPGRGGDVVLFERVDGRWIDISPDDSGGVATYPAAAAIGGHAHFFWHRRTANRSGLPTQIVYLEPDQRTDPPIVAGANFDLGERSRSSRAEFTWRAPADASGIVGYAYEWSRDPDAPVPTPENPIEATSAAFTADEDGPWYLRIRALDRAGNWSPPRTAEFFRDTTPPGRVAFEPPPLDEDGFLASNTFTLRWNPPEDDVIGGYYTDLVYLGQEDEELDPGEVPVIEPPERAAIERPAISRDNYDNGLWALAVSAVDSVGNVGEPAVLVVRMNKYIPVTEIYTVTAIPDPLDRYNLSILGRGFTANGVIERVVIDRDRQAPFDYVYDSSSPGYQIFSDRAMAGPLLDNLDTGEYYIGLVHSERGLEFAPDVLSLERNGTVKFGDYTVLPGREFVVAERGLRIIDSTTAIAWSVVALMLVVAVFSGTRLVAIGREGVQLRMEARALIAGKPGLLATREQRIQNMRRKGLGLRIKFALFVVVLVMAVVGMVSVGLGSATLNSQQLVLLRGLKDRVDVLMESLVAGAEEPLLEPDTNTLELDAVPASVRAMDEALYATITGPKSTIQTADLPESFNYVWGTNDPRLEAAGVTEAAARDELLRTRVAEGIERSTIPPARELDFGRTRIDDPVADKVEVLAELVDRIAADRLNTIVKERELTFATANELRRQINAVIAEGGDPTDLQERRQRAQLNLAALNQQITQGLEDVVIDALSLVRLAELEALREVTATAGAADGADEDPESQASRRHAAVSAAVYRVPQTMEEIEADIARARDELSSSERFSAQADSPVKSFPVFVAADYDAAVRDFLFYQPAVQPDISIFPLDREAIERMDEGDLAGLTYFRGTVRMGVATDLIVDQIEEARGDIIRITALIALAAVGAGSIAAIILATIVVIPINKLVRGVEYIRRTQDKSTLKDHSIDLKSRDELYRLADSINTMTVALAAAAEAEKDLIVTSDLQKKFIPLEEKSEDGRGRKLTMAHLDVAGAEFHGYYEGADALSGDYFTYEWIDKPVEQGGSVFALIKCDVSGHGVNAAFIMVEVATIFLNRVRDWRTRRSRPQITDLVNTVNDLLVERGFEGMFAAMTVAIVDTNSGTITMTHGGDTEQRFYRAALRKVEEHNLNQAPATGVFDGSLFPPGMGFEEVTFKLQSGDIMLLATDGIEESARQIRDDNFEPIAVSEDEAQRLNEEARALDPPSAIDVDDNSRIAKEEFSTDRMVRIIEEVQTQGSFELSR
ncbi:MAG: SpoIIE family protein phosphatase, partial [Spirochaetota bacterium]